MNIDPLQQAETILNGVMKKLNSNQLTMLDLAIAKGRIRACNLPFSEFEQAMMILNERIGPVVSLRESDVIKPKQKVVVLRLVKGGKK